MTTREPANSACGTRVSRRRGCPSPAQPAVIAVAAGVDRPVLRHHRQVAVASRGQADALVAKHLRPSRARRLLLVQHVAESKMAVLAFAPGKELAVLGHGDGEFPSARRHRPRPDSWDACKTSRCRRIRSSGYYRSIF